jgi:hypothetical protein
VFIDGKLVMENRKVLTVDEDEILDRCQELGDQVLARGKLVVPSRWPIY